VPGRTPFDRLAGMSAVTGSCRAHIGVFLSGNPSGCLRLGFCSPARDVTGSAGAQRVLCQTSLLLWAVADAGPKRGCGRTDGRAGERALALLPWKTGLKMEESVSNPLFSVFCVQPASNKAVKTSGPRALLV